MSATSSFISKYGHPVGWRKPRSDKGSVHTPGKRKVKWEKPAQRCACHHMKPCPSGKAAQGDK